jgi:CelD/BcsL family acetyltransferase involved in cellulose biosynthesis
MQESKGEKRDFLVPDRQAFFQAIMDRMYQEGLARLIFLEVEGERVAAVVCFDHAGRRFLYNSGYRLSHSHYSVGILLKALCIEDAIREGLVYFDFLRGPEPYKYDLGGKDVNLYRIPL